jgi:predicted glycoside hydrolase/deacetylase ChbG (UPF0249 family)
MLPNPALRKLGFSNHDRVAIIHMDDIGMCQASISAFADLVEYGLISSGATMVPCPWFSATAEFCRQNPLVDMGVHLTLNSEWDSYRWAPISTSDPESGLIDQEGYFHRRQPEVHEQAESNAVQKELKAQLERASSAGIDVTHVDTHMGTVAHPKFISGYVQLAIEHRLPPMILRKEQAGYETLGMDPYSASFAAQFVLQLEEQGFPLLDQLIALELDSPNDRIEQAIAALEDLPEGITHFIIHPSKDTPELRAITSDWASRVADYQAFTSTRLKDYIRNSGIQIIGYRSLRALIRGE